jgi:ring-1,2-phenylacetyl-CoA epoxidase subunit PaaD
MVNETQKNDCRFEPDPSAQSRSDHRESRIHLALTSVTDPEIPVLSVIDMGMIAGVRIDEGRVTVDVTPTFVGCPAIDRIREDIRTALKALGEHEVAVNIVFHPPWTSDRITETGRRKLQAFGLAPPSRECGSTGELGKVECPYCGSRQTDLESLFGPTLCRSIHYCRSCLQSFEHFKPV